MRSELNLFTLEKRLRRELRRLQGPFHVERVPDSKLRGETFPQKILYTGLWRLHDLMTYRNGNFWKRSPPRVIKSRSVHTFKRRLDWILPDLDPQSISLNKSHSSWGGNYAKISSSRCEVKVWGGLVRQQRAHGLTGLALCSSLHCVHTLKTK